MQLRRLRLWLLRPSCDFEAIPRNQAIAILCGPRGEIICNCCNSMVAIQLTATVVAAILCCEFSAAESHNHGMVFSRQVLGVKPDATHGELQRAYRVKALKVGAC